ncbi:hypothetical protein TNCV_4328281 [Trichonephila clavipes]|nr:hypothetical protein TNCV_4328281 [Trichonephila clavipes]
MAPYRRKKPAPTDLSTDEEDMITYDVEEDELEQHPDLVQKDVRWGLGGSDHVEGTGEKLSFASQAAR